MICAPQILAKPLDSVTNVAPHPARRRILTLKSRSPTPGAGATLGPGCQQQLVTQRHPPVAGLNKSTHHHVGYLICCSVPTPCCLIENKA